MKWSAILLVLNLLSTVIPFDMLTFSSDCCAEKTELCDVNSDADQDKDCCEDGNCQCLCCHISSFIVLKDGAFAQNSNVFFETNFTYQFLYSHDTYESLLRPPLV